MRPAPPALPACLLPRLQGWCNLTNVKRFKHLMLKLGLYRRLHAPAALLRQHERRIRQRLAAAAGSGGDAAAAGEAGGMAGPVSW